MINGTISKVASTYFADEVATTAPKRSHGAYDCPLAVLSCTVRTNSFPYGIVSLPGGGFSASGFKEQEEQNKYLLPIPKLVSMLLSLRSAAFTYFASATSSASDFSRPALAAECLGAVESD